MGIAKGAACLLYELKRDHPIGGTILQLGKQSLYVEADQLPGIAQRFGFTVDISNISFDETGEYVESTYNDIVFFQKLGFQQVSSLDVNDYEGASIVQRYWHFFSALVYVCHVQIVSIIFRPSPHGRTPRM